MAGYVSKHEDDASVSAHPGIMIIAADLARHLADALIRPRCRRHHARRQQLLLDDLRDLQLLHAGEGVVERVGKPLELIAGRDRDTVFEPSGLHRIDARHQRRNRADDPLPDPETEHDENETHAGRNGGKLAREHPHPLLDEVPGENPDQVITPGLPAVESGQNHAFSLESYDVTEKHIRRIESSEQPRELPIVVQAGMSKGARQVRNDEQPHSVTGSGHPRRDLLEKPCGQAV
ncbi:MAG: hypothetical protein BWY66_00634 [bacterium ADurb.Bin374]|nr:MAG: hypothetical protein BWY66_00634 [bacterium ADurb.Bin374]